MKPRLYGKVGEEMVKFWPRVELSNGSIYWDFPFFWKKYFYGEYMNIYFNVQMNPTWVFYTPPSVTNGPH